MAENGLTERQRFEALAAFLPVFAAPDFEFGRWQQTACGPDLTNLLSQYVLSPEAEAFRRTHFGRGP